MGSPPKSEDSRPLSACSASSPSPATPQAVTMPLAHPRRSMHAHSHGRSWAEKHLPWLLSPPACLRDLRGQVDPGRYKRATRDEWAPRSRKAAERIGGTGLVGQWGCSQAFRTRPWASSSRKGQWAGLGKGRALQWPHFLQTQSGRGHRRPATDGSICWMIQFACSDFSKGLTQGKGAFSALWVSCFSHDSRH